MSRIFVGNLPYSLDDAEIRAAIVGLGVDVDEFVVIKDRETKQSRGFGFLTTQMPLDEAISALDGVEVGGRYLRANEAHERAPRPGDHGSRRQPHQHDGHDDRRGKKRKKKRRDRDHGHDRW